MCLLCDAWRFQPKQMKIQSRVNKYSLRFHSEQPTAGNNLNAQPQVSIHSQTSVVYAYNDHCHQQKRINCRFTHEHATVKHTMLGTEDRLGRAHTVRFRWCEAWQQSQKGLAVSEGAGSSSDHKGAQRNLLWHWKCSQSWLGWSLYRIYISQTHQNPHLKSLHFTVCKFYLNRPINI